MSGVLRLALAKGRLYDGAVERLTHASSSVATDASRGLLVPTRYASPESTGV